jgi:hypothetical protein
MVGKRKVHGDRLSGRLMPGQNGPELHFKGPGT